MRAGIERIGNDVRQPLPRASNRHDETAMEKLEEIELGGVLNDSLQESWAPGFNRRAARRRKRKGAARTRTTPTRRRRHDRTDAARRRRKRKDQGGQTRRRAVHGNKDES